ncbi:hypothetical protein ACRJ4B_31580 [Streptomyces sp. GTA36]
MLPSAGHWPAGPSRAGPSPTLDAPPGLRLGSGSALDCDPNPDADPDPAPDPPPDLDGCGVAERRSGSTRGAVLGLAPGSLPASHRTSSRASRRVRSSMTAYSPRPSVKAMSRAVRRPLTVFSAA